MSLQINRLVHLKTCTRLLVVLIVVTLMANQNTVGQMKKVVTQKIEL